MNIFKFWLGFFQFYAVDPDEVSTEAPAAEVVDDVDDGKADEPKTMVEALTKDIGTVEQPKEEVRADEIKKEEVKAEEKPLAKTDGLTDDDLEMPQGLKKESQERFQKLVNVVKEQTTQLEEAKTNYEQASMANQEFVTAMDNVGAGANELNSFIDYMGHVKSGNLEDAYKILSAELNQLSTMMGKEMPGVDLLKDYPDLANQVENFDITRESAIELATARNQRQHQAQDQENQQQSQNAEIQQKESVQQGLEGVKQFELNQSKTDIDFKAKQAIITEKNGNAPSILEEIIWNNSPDRWVSLLNLAYRAIRNVSPPPVAKASPLRSSGVGGGKPEATNMLEAIKQGLAASA